VALQLLWEHRNQQRPAAQPQHPDEPIHNDPNAPYDNTTVPPGDDHIDSAPETEPASSMTDASTGRGLIIQPPGVDVKKLQPQVVLHIHLSEQALLSYHNDSSRFGGGVGRFEGVGPITMGQVRRFPTDTSCHITVQPVIDPHNATPVDGYQIPRRIRDAMFLRMPASCFPYPTTASGRLELDHTKAYLPPARGGPPGQTGIHNLGPLIRFEHRIKTHSRWQLRQPEPGVWLWRSPHRALYLVTNAGTHTLGDGPFARQLWRAATPAKQRAPAEPG
jgi:hypothetical protein